MARVQYGSIITDIKGSIGGLTFQSSGNGKIVRQRPYQRKQPNAAQSTYNNEFLGVTSYWRLLSGANKDAWAVFAADNNFTDRWGSVKTLTGYQWFHLCNNNRALMGLNYLQSPVTPMATLAVPSYDAYFNSNEVAIEFDPAFDHTDYKLFIFTTRPRFSPVVSDRSKYRLTTIVNPDTSDVIDVTTDWENVHNLSLSDISANVKCCVVFAIMSVNRSAGYPSPFNIESDYF
jgi:hypothetical protein